MAISSWGLTRSNMTDVHTKAQRSQNMSHIRSKANRTTEIRVVELFRKYGIKGWRRNSAIFGHPDFVFPAVRLAVFVDGCFWHGCSRCKFRPASNILYGNEKLSRNRKRDRLVNQTLKLRGWLVIRIWEHSLNRPRRFLSRIAQEIRKD